MKMIRSVVLCLVMASLALSMTLPPTMKTHHSTHSHHTHGPRTTKEHPEKGGISFFYDPHTHYMAGRTDGHCYVLRLTAEEQKSVHTPLGLERLEFTIIKMITGGEDTLETDDMTGNPRAIIHFCHGRQMYALGVPGPTSTATPAPTLAATTAVVTTAATTATPMTVIE